MYKSLCVFSALSSLAYLHTFLWLTSPVLQKQKKNKKKKKKNKKKKKKKKKKNAKKNNKKNKQQQQTNKHKKHTRMYNSRFTYSNIYTEQPHKSRDQHENYSTQIKVLSVTIQRGCNWIGNSWSMGVNLEGGPGVYKYSRLSLSRLRLSLRENLIPVSTWKSNNR